jgi:hypothetical protein
MQDHLMEHLVEQLYKLIRSRKHEIGEQMIYGGVKDLEHYHGLVGEVRALQMVEDRMTEILTKVESDK